MGGGPVTVFLFGGPAATAFLAEFLPRDGLFGGRRTNGARHKRCEQTNKLSFNLRCEPIEDDNVVDTGSHAQRRTFKGGAEHVSVAVLDPIDVNSSCNEGASSSYQLPHARMTKHATDTSDVNLTQDLQINKNYSKFQMY